MAIQAVAAHNLLRCADWWNTGAAIGGARMETGCVTTLAQPGPAVLQQIFVIGTMRDMAIGAVFGHRLVFPQERPAFLGVAVVAGFVNRRADQL